MSGDSSPGVVPATARSCKNNQWGKTLPSHVRIRWLGVMDIVLGIEHFQKFYLYSEFQVVMRRGGLGGGSKLGLGWGYTAEETTPLGLTRLW